MLLAIGGGIAVLVGGLLAYASTRPDSFRIERSAVIGAPPEAVAARVADFKAWAEWSPWEKKDPAMKKTFGGPASGPGATYAWEGNKQVGTGSMQVLEASGSLVRVRLDFLKPFEAHNTAEFTFVPEGAGTRVTWAMFGPSPFMAKVMGLFMDMDRMVVPDFEAGLAALKAVSEKGTR